MEVLIAILLVISAGYILFKNIKKSSKGNCNCGSCPSKCPKYKK